MAELFPPPAQQIGEVVECRGNCLVDGIADRVRKALDPQGVFFFFCFFSA